MPTLKSSALGLVLLIGALSEAACFGAFTVPFEVSIKNDTSETVVLGHCGLGPADWFLRRKECDVIQGKDRIKPDHSFPVNAVPDKAYPQWFLVEDTAGTRLGCLELLFAHRQENAVVNVSQMVPCPKSILTK